jgi:hypothetical protein
VKKTRYVVQVFNDDDDIWRDFCLATGGEEAVKAIKDMEKHFLSKRQYRVIERTEKVLWEQE